MADTTNTSPIPGLLSNYGLTANQSVLFKAAQYNQESIGTGGYTAVNSSSQAYGLYQIQSAGLQDVGLVQQGTGSNLTSDSAWVNPGGAATFLNNPTMQDTAISTMANNYASVLQNAGLITPGVTDPAVAASSVAAALRGGPGNAIPFLQATQSNQQYSGPYGPDMTLAYNNTYSTITGAGTGPINTLGLAAGGVSSVTPPLDSTPVTLLPFSGAYGIPNNYVVSSTNGISSTQVSNIDKTNILESFASYNMIITLSCISSNSFNSPDTTYINGDIGLVVCKNGGLGSNTGIGIPEYKTSQNPTGAYEYFIDDLEMKHIIKTSNGSNLTQLTFNITEPYSVGMFPIALAKAAEAMQYPSYLSAHFLLTISFIGYDDNGNVITDNRGTYTRYIPINIQNFEFDIKGSATVYTVHAMPSNEIMNVNQYKHTRGPISVSGSAVAELLQTGSPANGTNTSVQYALNSLYQQNQKAVSPSAVPTEVVILFPKPGPSSQNNQLQTTADQSLTKNPSQPNNNQTIVVNTPLTRINGVLVQTSGDMNDIGLASMNFNMYTSGTGATKDAKAIQPDPSQPIKRSANMYNPKNQEFRFLEGTTPQQMITEIVLMSSYCQKSYQSALDQAYVSSSGGMIPWFRIETQVVDINDPDIDTKTFGKPQLFIYRVVPFSVHVSALPTPTGGYNYDSLKSLVAREYDYIYTGKNTSILNFDLKFKCAWALTPGVQGMMATAGSTLNMTGGDQKKPTIALAVSSTDSANLATPVSKDSAVSKVSTPQSGGGPGYTTEALLAKTFHDNLVTSPDLVTGNLEILGDPYYIADSGMGNYIAASQSFNYNTNGSMNYQSGEVDILINFKTPTDYDDNTGLMNFTNFSEYPGLYLVTTVVSRFNKGKFTQSLDLVHRYGQIVGLNNSSSNSLTQNPNAPTNPSTQSTASGSAAITFSNPISAAAPK